MDFLRYQPFRAASALFDDLLGEFAAPVSRPAKAETPFSPAVPMRVDIREENGAYCISADLPGLSKEDIQVTAKGDVLTIAAQARSQAEKTQGGRVLHRERRPSYARSFRLATEINLDQATAKYENGVLELTLPKSQAKRISVH